MSKNLLLGRSMSTIDDSVLRDDNKRTVSIILKKIIPLNVWLSVIDCVS